MLSVPQFKSLCETLITEIPDFKRYILCATDEQAMKKLSDKFGITLVAVYPSADINGSSGSKADNQSLLFFAVDKFEFGSSEIKEQEAYDKTQKCILALREYIIDQHENGCSTFFRLQVSSMAIIPEYNIFGGYIGWSLTLTF